jgi:glycosyltransferase involved in cell wall biosynthesis
MVISLLHPSRQRPEKSLSAIRRWEQRAYSKNYEIIVSIDDSDPDKEKYLNYHQGKKVVINSNRSAVDAINNAAKEATGDILVVVSDDTDCPSAWDDKILNACAGHEDFVLKVNDGIQKWIITMPVMDRKYYERFGYVYPPDYSHMFTDTHFTHVAELLDRVIWRNDILFPHMHYSVAKAKRDELNERNDATWNEGKRTYLKHFRNNFGLGGNVNPWKISNDQHVQWLKNALRQ